MSETWTINPVNQYEKFYSFNDSYTELLPRCEFINYSDIAVFNVDISFKVQILKTDVNRNGERTGSEVIAERDLTARIDRVDNSKGVFLFYIWDAPSNFTRIIPGEYVTTEIAHASNRIKTKLKNVSSMPIILLPRKD